MAADINLTYKEYCADKSSGSLERLVADGEGIVRHFASVYGEGYDRDDLFQTGMIGLLRAAKTFDPDCGAVFSTWATQCVISEIRHFVRSERSFHRPPIASDESGSKADNDTDSGADSLADGEKERNSNAADSYSASTFAVVMPLCDADGANIQDRQSSFHLDVEDKIALEQAAANLGIMQRNVIDALYYRGMTQQQTANELGITQRRVSRLKCAAIGILHELLDPSSFHLVESKYSFKNISKVKCKK